MQFEIDRRQRLETALDALNPAVRTRLVKVVDGPKAQEMAGTRFANLPEGVTFTPKSLTLEFQDSKQFLQLLGAVLKALENDTDEVISFVDEGTS